MSQILVNIDPSQEKVARGPQKRGLLGYGLLGLCVNPSLAGPDLTCARPYANPLVRLPHPLL